MTFQALIVAAKQKGASDLHLEPGMPVTIRVRGTLHMQGDPLSHKLLAEWARELIGAEAWPQFLRRRSIDFSRTIGSVRCRINVLHTSRGIGFAVRLLASFRASINKLNLHPELKKLVAHTTGLILISGATGSGKSSTLAALIQEINFEESRHILTLESPIEYVFRGRRAFIRQREIGRDTPSFEQGLIDALREDPDVLMVGELREPETMRLTINAAETGHLVLATVHSGTCAEALQRIVLAFPSEIQNNIAAQLADCLIAVVCQRLRFKSDLNLRIPECEILRSTTQVKTFIRNRDFFKLPQALETGAEHGMWSFERYQSWILRRSQWHVPSVEEDEEEIDPNDERSLTASDLPEVSPKSLPNSAAETGPQPLSSAESKHSIAPIEIEPVEGGLNELIKRLT